MRADKSVLAEFDKDTFWEARLYMYVRLNKHYKYSAKHLWCSLTRFLDVASVLYYGFHLI